MRPRSFATRALPFTFALYAFEATLATLFALPLALEVARHLTGIWDASQVALALDGLRELAPALRVVSGSSLLSMLLLALLSPWLQMSWYAALEEPLGVFGALARGARSSMRACWATLFVGVLAVLLLGPFVGLAYALHRGLSASTAARFHDLAVLAALTPVLPLLGFLWVLHDLARAGALHERAFASVLRALRVGLRWRILFRALALSGAGYGCVLFVLWLGLGPGAGAWRLLLPTLLQCALFGRLFLRSAWLSTALTCMHPQLETVARRE